MELSTFGEGSEDENLGRMVAYWKVIDSDESSSDDDSISADEGSFLCGDMRKSFLLAWMANVRRETDGVVHPPPLYILHYPDILNQGWGWQRLLPYSPESVDWPVFKGYLKDYFSHNANAVATLCAHHMSGAAGQGISAGRNDLRAAALLCVEIEDKILQGSCGVLSTEDIILSCDIKKRAEHMIQSAVESSAASVGGESSAAAIGGESSATATAALVCIAKEGELICELLKCQFDITYMLELSNQIRRSAFNLMLNGGLESAGAMMGMAEEARILHQLIVEDPVKYLENVLWEKIRERTTTILAILEQELACDTTATGDGNDTFVSSSSEKPIRTSVKG